MSRHGQSLLVVGVAMAAAVFTGGCAATGEGGARDQVTANVGNYDPAPPNVDRPRVGVPPFAVETTPRGVALSGQDLQRMASDQLSTLLHRTERFAVIERAQLEQLLREQDLEGIVRPDEMAQMGQVRGVDYLLIGRITGFRVRTDRTERGVGVGRGVVADRLLGGATGGVERGRATISTEIGVDIRLVDPETGETVVAEFTDFKREDTAESFGIDVAGIGGRGDAEVRLDEDDAGKVLRMAFDDAIRKTLPRIDRMLTERHTATPTELAGD